MPVTDKFIPKESEALKEKIRSNPEDPSIPEQVKAHLEKSGHAVYAYSLRNPKDVQLSSVKCIIFLIGGVFEVGEERCTIQGIGYLVEKEAEIQLQKNTIVVIIDQS